MKTRLIGRRLQFSVQLYIISIQFENDQHIIDIHQEQYAYVAVFSLATPTGIKTNKKMIHCRFSISAILINKKLISK